MFNFNSAPVVDVSLVKDKRTLVKCTLTVSCILTLFNNCESIGEYYEKHERVR